MIGIPQALEAFDPTNHNPLLTAALKQRGDLFAVNEIKVSIAGRPRPVNAKLAISRRTRAAILVDIPTALSASNELVWSKNSSVLNRFG